MRTTAVTSYVLQAYLAVNPASPRWCDVTFSAVAGWEDYQKWERGHLIRDPRLHGSSGWRFVSAEAAREVLGELLSKHHQDHHLRVIQRYETVHEQFIGGADIPDGRLVPDPSGKNPPTKQLSISSSPRYLGVSRRLSSSVSAPPDVLEGARGTIQEPLAPEQPRPTGACYCDLSEHECIAAGHQGAARRQRLIEADRMGDYLSDARDLIQRAHSILQGIVISSRTEEPR